MWVYNLYNYFTYFLPHLGRDFELLYAKKAVIFGTIFWNLFVSELIFHPILSYSNSQKSVMEISREFETKKLEEPCRLFYTFYNESLLDRLWSIAEECQSTLLIFNFFRTANKSTDRTVDNGKNEFAYLILFIYFEKEKLQL